MPKMADSSTVPINILIPKKRPPSSSSGPAAGGNNPSKIASFQDLYKKGLFDSCMFLMNLEKKDNYFESSAENILFADLLVKVCMSNLNSECVEKSSFIFSPLL